ncbi:MAG: HEPN domain-containing protein [Planctomycetes bacterium]|nr:HEPN domain-containing protein [Planctomycetota bacterium]
MKPAASEWVAKAEGDFASLQREFAATNPPNHDLVCFLSQQCSEKDLKCRLIEAGIGFPKTHDLAALLDLVLPIEPTWVTFRADLDWLTDLGIEVRYPGLFAGSDDAQRAICIARSVRSTARAAFGLPL